MLKKLSFLIFITHALFAASSPDLLNGIVLTDKVIEENWHAYSHVKGVHLHNVEIPGTKEKLENALREELGAELTFDLLERVKEKIATYFDDNQGPIVYVQLPEQKVENGVVQFVVVFAKAGKISVKNNKHFKEKRLVKFLNISSGRYISKEVLLNNVAWMNRNPFLQAEVRLKPGELFEGTDIDILIKDQFPFKPYIGVDNSGINVTGETRVYAGFKWGNVFGRHDVLNYQYTADKEFKRFESHFASYLSFLPWHAMLLGYGGYTRSNPDIDYFSHVGKSWQVSFRYLKPFKPLYGDTMQELTYGFDFRNTNSNLTFLGENEIPIVAQSANLSQLMVGYTYSFSEEKKSIVCNLEAFVSPAKGMFPDQSDDRYEQIRMGARVRYIYARGSFSYVVAKEKKGTMAFLFRGQVASGTLLPSEQYGLGGYNTVRGYDEHEYNGDCALNTNIEFRSNAIPLHRNKKDRFIALLFADLGVGYNYNHLSTFPGVQLLAGVGPGIRYGMSENISARIDYGFKLNHFSTAESLGKLHFGVIGTF